ncbi:methionine adenosyltransferase domain-containing protein [archaeon]|nr:methionine adenosyltransferase domain-containing protein [archaeon]
MSEKISHSFEAGRRGKPDELDSGIANLVSSYLLSVDLNSRFDLRVSGTYREGKPFVRVSGEISDFLLKGGIKDKISRIVLDRYNWVHRTNLQPEELQVEFTFKPQSYSLASNESAGDSGNPIAVAYRNTPNHLPWERFLAVSIRDILDSIQHNNGVVPQEIARFSGVKELNGLRSDGKVSVDVLYNNHKLDSLTQITIAAEHEPSLSVEELREKVNKILVSYLANLERKHQTVLSKPIIDINGLGGWHDGGWEVDEGSREAKPYRDAFASYGVQEDSFSGEDPTKPSSTGTFIARNIAVQVVGNNLADFARVSIHYTIGKEEVGLNIFTNNTGKLSQEELEELIRKNIPLRINEGIKIFNLKNPKLYKQFTEDSDFFHNNNLPWNQVRELLV